MNRSAHEACVDRWLDECDARGVDAARRLPLFERALGALLDRARQTLGDVTLTAILDRVLYTSAETFPLLAALKLDGHALRWDGLRESSHRDGELKAGMRFVLVEFLTVLGNLTAEILTPALHADLASVAPVRDGKAARAPRAERPKTIDEGKP